MASASPASSGSVSMTMRGHPGLHRDHAHRVRHDVVQFPRDLRPLIGHGPADLLGPLRLGGGRLLRGPLGLLRAYTRLARVFSPASQPSSTSATPPMAARITMAPPPAMVAASTAPATRPAMISAARREETATTEYRAMTT